MGTLKPQSNGPYSNMVIGTLAIDGWAVTFGTARMGPGGAAALLGMGGLLPRPDPSSLYQPISAQCTNFILLDVALLLHLHSKGLIYE